MHSKQKGTLAETRIMADLYKKGFCVSVPMDDLVPFDLICVDINNNYKLYKVQVKYCKLNKGVIDLWVRCAMSNKTLCYTKRYTPDEVDIFAAYCPETDDCLYIKSDILYNIKSSFKIRMDHTKPNDYRAHFKEEFLDFPL
jgi:hypothetical protein